MSESKCVDCEKRKIDNQLTLRCKYCDHVIQFDECLRCGRSTDECNFAEDDFCPEEY